MTVSLHANVIYDVSCAATYVFLKKKTRITLIIKA